MVSQNPPTQEQAFYDPEPEPEFHLSQWIEVIRRRRTLAIVVAGVVVACSLILYVITPRVYRATAIIQIEKKTANVVGGPSWSFDDYYDSQSFYPTQYRLLQSRGLAERVLTQLRLADDPRFNPQRGSLFRETPQPSTASADEARTGALARRLLGGVTITPVRDTRLVEISYVSTSPEMAAAIANGWAESFIDWNVEARFRSMGKASSFLATQIDTIKQEIQDKEAQLQAYSRRQDIVALDPSSNVIVQRLQSLNDDYGKAMSDRISKEAKYRELQASPPDVAVESLSGGIVQQLRGDVARLEREYAAKLNVYKPEWPAMQELRAQIDKGRQNLKDVIEETVAKARESAKAEYQAALRREESLAAELNRQKADAMQLNSAAVEYNTLKSDVTTRRALLDQLLKRQSETEVESRLKGTSDSNVSIVDRALVPNGPFRPSLPRNLFLGLVLGLGLGLGAVFFLEYLDRTIKTPDDVERHLGVPVLAVIPDVEGGSSSYGYASGYGYGYGHGHRSSKAGHSAKKKQQQAAAAGAHAPGIEMIPALKPRVAAAEAYRSLRTALLLSSAHGLKVIVVTSAAPAEGKTVTASNLAIVLAQLGRDVLLVDADLRKPRLHEILELSNRVGLVNVLTGSAEAAAVMLRTRVPNLYVTPAGPNPPNPAELLASERFDQFIQLARERFEYVVFDTPPVLPVTDAIVIAARCDGTVVCVGAGGVVREDARAGIERLRLAEIHIVGAALNRFHVGPGKYSKRYRDYDAYSAATAPETETDKA
jgi:capsular exopolysaccharide synthesis family protein